MSVVGEVVQWARRWQLEHPCAQRRPCAPLEKEAIIDAIRCSAIMPFQVVWVVEGSAGDAVTLSHREFRKEADAAAFFEQLGDRVGKRLTLRGREVRKAMRGAARAWPWEWVPDHPAADVALVDLVGPAAAARLGALAPRVRVRFDPRMPPNAHGRSERCAATQLALCRVNPATPDRTYTVLHEFMHHQLDWLGCPALACPQVGRAPDGRATLGGVRLPAGHFLGDVDLARDPNFFPQMVTKLWELVQHARFNARLRADFACGPEPARDAQMADLLSGRALFPYCDAAADPPGLRHALLAFHFATALLECSPAAQARMRAALQRTPEGAAAAALGQRLRDCIHVVDSPVCGLSEEEAAPVMGGMLLDLEGALNAFLQGGAAVELGDVRPAGGDHGPLVLGRSKAVADIRVRPAAPPPP